MIEDKLTQGQRIRLESLAQAVAANQMRGSWNAGELVATAKVFEEYVAGSNDDDSFDPYSEVGYIQGRGPGIEGEDWHWSPYVQGISHKGDPMYCTEPSCRRKLADVDEAAVRNGEVIADGKERLEEFDREDR